MNEFDYQMKLYNKYIASNANITDIYERYGHSLSVALTAVSLIKHYQLDNLTMKGYLAGLLHDYAKFLTKDDYLKLIEKHNLDKNLINESAKTWHGKIGVYAVMDDLLIDDTDVLNAIKYHVVGRCGMTILEKIIYIADFIEPMRYKPSQVKAREYAFIDIDLAVAYISDATVMHLEKTGLVITGDTLETKNYYQKYLKG